MVARSLDDTFERPFANFRTAKEIAYDSPNSLFCRLDRLVSRAD
jgi:hypothetical protein